MLRLGDRGLLLLLRRKVLLDPWTDVAISLNDFNIEVTRGLLVITNSVGASINLILTIADGNSL